MWTVGVIAAWVGSCDGVEKVSSLGERLKVTVQKRRTGNGRSKAIAERVGQVTRVSLTEFTAEYNSIPGRPRPSGCDVRIERECKFSVLMALSYMYDAKTSEI